MSSVPVKHRKSSEWKSFAEGSCGTETVDPGSVVGIMSHINVTLQQYNLFKHDPSFILTFVE